MPITTEPPPVYLVSWIMRRCRVSAAAAQVIAQLVFLDGRAA